MLEQNWNSVPERGRLQYFRQERYVGLTTREICLNYKVGLTEKTEVYLSSMETAVNPEVYNLNQESPYLYLSLSSDKFSWFQN